MHILAFILIFVVGCIVIRSIMVIYPACFIDNCYCSTGFNCDMLLCKVA